jgi:hypothetical protein
MMIEKMSMVMMNTMKNMMNIDMMITDIEIINILKKILIDIDEIIEVMEVIQKDTEKMMIMELINQVMVDMIHIMKSIDMEIITEMLILDTDDEVIQIHIDIIKKGKTLRFFLFYLDLKNLSNFLNILSLSSKIR